MTLASCPACNLPYALVGRAHRCVPREATKSTEGNPAGAQAVGAYQASMCVTPPSAGGNDHLFITANLGEPASTSNVVSIRKPKRDRAAYMRDYGRAVKQRTAGSTA